MNKTETATQGDLTMLSSALDIFGDIFGTIAVAWFNLMQAFNR